MTQAPASGAEDRRMTDDEIIESIGGYEYGWHDSDDYSKDVPTGINEEIVRFISDVKDETAVDAGASPQGPRAVRAQADAGVGPGPVSTWTLTRSSTTCAPRIDRSTTGRTCPRKSVTPTIAWVSPKPRRPRLVSGVAAQYESEVVYQQIQEDLERQGVIFTDTAPACVSTPKSSRNTSASVCRPATTSSRR